MDMVVMVVNLMHVHHFHYQMVNGVKIFVIFGIDNSSSMHANNRKKDILVLGQGSIDGLDNNMKKKQG